MTSQIAFPHEQHVAMWALARVWLIMNRSLMTFQPVESEESMRANVALEVLLLGVHGLEVVFDGV